MTQPLAIDLFCGLGGWTDGLLAEGYRMVGFDITQHAYGEQRYPAQLVIQDPLYGRFSLWILGYAGFYAHSPRPHHSTPEK